MLLSLSARAQDIPAPPAAIAEKAELCATCHGADGRPVNEESPIIWGQEYYYLFVQMRDFQAGRRASDIMQPIVKDMRRDDMKALAEYFSKLSWPSLQYRASDADNAKAVSVAAAGQCTQCHLGAYKGDSRVPRLAGQNVVYLEKTLQDFKKDIRKNAADMSALMRVFPDEDIAAMAHFLAGL
jgi:cytochrome c553